MSAPRPAPFDRKVLIGLGVFCLASFVFGLLFSSVGPSSGAIDSAGTDAFSRSALGHRAAADVLRALDVPVLVARNDPWRRTHERSVLIIAEPRLAALDSEPARRLRRALERARGGTLVVLPRFRPRLDPDHPEWVRHADESPPSDALLEALQIGGGVVTVPKGEAWTSTLGLPAPAPVMAVQALSNAGPAITVLARVGGAMVIGQHDDGHVVLTDPMLFNTAGLSQPANAALLVALLAALSPEGGPVVFDETTHGFGTAAGVWARLFEFPLGLATLQAVLVMALVFWVAMRRFGAPEAAPPALGRGRTVLVENVARMGWFAGHGGPVLERYWQATRRAVADGLHAPAHLTGPALDAWLDRVASVRQVDDRVAQLAPVVDAASLKARETERLVIARRIHAWRVAMLGAT